ncbi:ARP2/3 complex 16 kDa subunit (p16-Arc) [Rhizopus microsporus ATCC 52813]|uniref:Actin-related protein 2/3 complex subunit 5 n=1 Tax=Rhizopus microsporus ATCC 52813 TaxID=1340429 RepID=A0A2G4T7F9_RHIZD|nr:ARP2/3 complex 16 kDa subunit (p16-Arc) [Rhizopus microsporus ATCC 52813]PHZ16921.1 ARP2/3 complex 16 kDa subunit (p16-Arc) [Rhizopus microsporus ATCC 52813]
MSWRKIDIDQYDEDAYTQDEILAEFETGLSPEEVNNATQTRNTDVRNFISRGDLNNALTRALEDPPYGRHLEAAKTESTKMIAEVLNMFRVGDISDIVKSLNHEQQDVLMKYIYAGLSKPELYNSSVLLTWHEKLTEVAGNGCIVRVMTDKRTVF